MNNKKIKILFLIDEFTALGGTEKQLILLADNLPCEHFEPVIGVLYNTPFLSDLKIKTPIIEFGANSIPFAKNLKLINKLRLYIKKNHIDIIQTQFVDSTIYTALTLLLVRPKPYFISTRRNLYHWIDEKPYLFRLLRITNRIANRVLVNSYRVFNECQKLENIPKDKIKLIQNAVEIDKFHITYSQEARRALGLDGKFPIIGVVGNWRRVKGLTSFIKAAALVSSEVPNAIFVLVGYGPQENELKSLARDLCIKDKVHFFRNYPNIPLIIEAFDITVQPSLSESFSNVLVEYMAAAKPVVASRVGDAEKIIEDGKNGLLVHPNNPEELRAAILDLYHNRDKASKMGKLAREKVFANWSSKKIIRDYQILYEDIFLHMRSHI